ncbi:SMC-Scp complex subunit ScpB [Methanotrichaceae archaeon M04Ac]|uniref:SMC-Scp complex subunit ScpB n=1 Tax=Candidatus Methanocrinis alkalitolerans TaxID=3033395 RepID=A0ABT5XC76_9EURY|nr:SMC-Scp complex subunit ScpB [Candidatus Methanocrinis alkalitolerans]MDF0592270.1 SMC-Scp complex subunit ScpB [Candidatus Methanocrinis alkalitolerans]
MAGEVSEDEELSAVVEAALFAAGRPLSIAEIAEATDLPARAVRSLADGLVREYSERCGGIEIREFEDRYVMQVRSSVAERVSKVGPKELEAPLLRTLAIIAYNQPMAQRELARIRGNKSYSHVKELEDRGLIQAAKMGRTKIITTTKTFAEYFGLDFDDPDFVKRVMKERKRLGVTPMYRSLAERMGLAFAVVNPYNPYKNDIEAMKSLDLLIIAPGYQERAKEHYSGELLEASVRTFTQLKETINLIAEKSGRFDQEKTESLQAEIDALLADYRGRAIGARPIRPLSPMIQEIALDLGVLTDEDGISAAPDYMGVEAEIQVPTHQPYEMDIIDRIRERYEAILKSLNDIGSSKEADKNGG